MSLVHSVHNNGQVPWGKGRSALSGDDDGLDGDDTFRLGKYDNDDDDDDDDDEKHHHFHHEHPGNIISSIAVGHPATDTVPAPRFSTSAAALHASSDQSTPSQSQSSASASSILTPLSAFRSSPSGAYAAADAKADADAGVNIDGVAGGSVDAAFPSFLSHTPHTPEQHGASKAKDDAGYDADDGDGDGNASADASGIEGLSSHALSLDQTRLRVAYLVSTMVQPPAAAAAATTASEGGDERTFWASQESVVLASSGPRQARPCRSLRPDEVTGAARFVHHPGLAIGARRVIPPVSDLDDLVRWFGAACPRVWETADPAKKRQKIFTIAMWQTEVAMEDAFAYCTCPAGEGVLLQRWIGQIDRRSTESAVPDPAVAEQSQPQSQPQPQPQPQSEQADSAGSNADSGDNAVAGLVKCCAQCRHPLPSQRPVVWVDDVGWSARAQEAAGNTIRRALRGLRSFWTKKNKRPVLTTSFLPAGLLHHTRDVPDGLREYKDSSAVGEQAAPDSREQGSGAGPAREPEQAIQPSKKTKQGGTGPTSSWDVWDERNCADLLAENPANAGAYFLRTSMYRTTDDAEEAEESSSTSDEHETAEARARRRKRKTEQRLRRAQGLLKRSVEPEPSPPPPKKSKFAGGAVLTSEMPELKLVVPFAE